MSAIKAVTIYTDNIAVCKLPYTDAEILLTEGPIQALLDRAEVSDYIIVDGASDTIKSTLNTISPAIKTGTIISDTCSSKAQSQTLLDGYNFKRQNIIPILPFSGTMILCPYAETDLKIIETVSQYWEMRGYKIELMPAKDCDNLVATASQLPEMLMVAMLDALDESDPSVKANFLQFFKGKSEGVANLSDEPLDRAIGDLVDNRQALDLALEETINKMTALRKSIKRSDTAYVKEVLGRAKELSKSLEDFSA